MDAPELENDVGVLRLHECNICNKNHKYHCRLVQHLSHSHDIGDYQCETCFKNVPKVTPFKSERTQNKEIDVCRECYTKYNDYSGRIEKKMAVFLEKEPQIKPFIILKNAIIKGNVCMTRRRPDLYIASTNKLHLMVECDEYQHRSYARNCERGRMDEILDEIPEGRVVFIRWNPHKAHKYQNNLDKLVVIKDNIPTRLETLRQFILHLIGRKEQEWPINRNYLVYYMYYSQNRKDLVPEYYYRHIYSVNDFKEPKRYKTKNFEDSLNNILEFSKKFLPRKDPNVKYNIKNAESPVLWLYEIIKRGEYYQLMRSDMVTDIPYEKYQKWCKRANKKIYRKSQWVICINRVKKERKILNNKRAKIYIKPKKKRTFRKSVYLVCAISQDECQTLIENRYETANFEFSNRQCRDIIYTDFY